uniref:VASt domain-containing protein n=1 Tax=Globisporangium ultimum (strain ATCC 200006 / CBS 805.95 / DAOM BR144) TaxID=431595 RepID=K3W8R8_GLOUD
MVMRDSSSKTSSAKCISSEAEDVAAEMVRLYDDTDSILKEIQASNDANAAFVTENSMHDVTLGKVFELRSSTPVLGSDFYLLGEFLWSYVTTAARNDESVETQPAPGENDAPNDFVHREEYTLTLETQSGTFEVQGVAFARKFDTPHRTVFTVTSTVRVPGSDLVIHQNSWLVASDHSSVTEDAPDSLGSSGKATLINALHRLSIKTSSSSRNEKWTSSTDPVDASKNLEQYVVKALSNRIRERQQLVQQVLGMF